MSNNIIDMQAYRRDRAIDAHIQGIRVARDARNLADYRNVMQSDDPLYRFFMGKEPARPRHQPIGRHGF